jgi:hypothetical protein
MLISRIYGIVNLLAAAPSPQIVSRPASVLARSDVFSSDGLQRQRECINSEFSPQMKGWIHIDADFEIWLHLICSFNFFALFASFAVKLFLSLLSAPQRLCAKLSLNDFFNVKARSLRRDFGERSVEPREEEVDRAEARRESELPPPIA